MRDVRILWWRVQGTMGVTRAPKISAGGGGSRLLCAFSSAPTPRFQFFVRSLVACAAANKRNEPRDDGVVHGAAAVGAIRYVRVSHPEARDPPVPSGVAPVSSLDEGDYLLRLSHVHIRVVMMNGDEASELSGVTAHARPGALARDCEYFFGRPNWREGRRNR